MDTALITFLENLFAKHARLHTVATVAAKIYHDTASVVHAVETAIALVQEIEKQQTAAGTGAAPADAPASPIALVSGQA